MARAAVQVNRQDLENAIKMVEANGPLKNRSALHDAVSEAMNDPKITPSVVLGRIKEWNLDVKTPLGRRGGGSDSKPSDEFTPSITTTTTHVANNRMRKIGIPCGKCPVKLAGLEYGQIQDWIDKLQNKAASQNEFLTHEAFIYWLRDFYDINDTYLYNQAKTALVDVLTS